MRIALILGSALLASGLSMGANAASKISPLPTTAVPTNHSIIRHAKKSKPLKAYGKHKRRDHARAGEAHEAK